MQFNFNLCAESRSTSVKLFYKRLNILSNSKNDQAMKKSIVLHIVYFMSVLL